MALGRAVRAGFKGQGSENFVASSDGRGQVPGLQRTADAGLRVGVGVDCVMDPPGPVVVPEVVQRVFALDADGEARGGGSAFGGVDHGVWMEAARSTINSGGEDEL